MVMATLSGTLPDSTAAIRAYQTVGFTPDRDYQYLEVNQFLRRLHPEIVGQTERMSS